MTRVSKNTLQEKHQKQLLTQLADLFSSVKTKKAAQLFQSLCTEAEQTMLVKRLAAILMIEKKYSRYHIAHTLSMSESTVREIQKKYDEGQYAEITVTIRQKEYEREQFWRTIDSLARLGMPSMGKDRWKSLR